MDALFYVIIFLLAVIVGLIFVIVYLMDALARVRFQSKGD